MIPINILKKVFKKDQVENFLKLNKPDLFGLKTTRSKKESYLGKDIWADLQKIDPSVIKDYTREYSLSTEGKYNMYHHNLDWVLENIQRTKVTKEESPCHPEQFSESVIKPAIRKGIQSLDQNIIENTLENIKSQLTNHVKERINQQLKADYSEYLIMINCPNIIPTLKHTKGTDMFLLKDDNTIEDLDIKTTRSTHNITTPREAIIALYENQGKDRFSSNPRLYIHLSGNQIPSREDIEKQLNTTYDIEFRYGEEKYQVIGTRIIFM